MTKRTVEIARTDQQTNRMRAIGIYINNKKIDTIKNYETKTYEVDSHRNEIYAKIDWCKTKPVKINFNENETIKLELGSKLVGWKTYFAFYYVFFKTSDFIYLKQI